MSDGDITAISDKLAPLMGWLSFDRVSQNFAGGSYRDTWYKVDRGRYFVFA